MKESSVGTATANGAVMLCLRDSLSSRALSPALCLIATAAVLAGLAVPGSEALGQTDFLGDDAMLLSGDPSPESKLNVSFDMTSLDRYVWRGLVLTGGPVFQPSVTVGRGPLSVNVWGNMDLDNVNDNQMEFNEIDLTVGWEDTFGLCTTSANAINYNFPNTAAETTTEIQLAAAFDVPAKPAISVYFDVAAVQGTYVTLDVAHAFSSNYGNPVGWELTLNTGIGWGSAEHNSLYYGVNAGVATDFHIAMTFAVMMHDKWTVAQSIVYISVADVQLRNAVAEEQTAAYGMTVTAKF